MKGFLDLLGEGRSDHAIQGIEIKQSGITLRGLTHNMLNQMHDMDHCPVPNRNFTNNPANLQETDAQYLKRKKAQLDFYIAKIKQNNSHIPYDFWFLQEVDILTKPLKDPNAEAERKEINNSFVEELKKLNWGLVKTKEVHGCKPLVTLYNKATLSHVKSNGHFKDFRNNKNTGFESIFTLANTNGQKVSLTNLHLDYDKSGETYSQEIAQFMQENTNANILSILGGDTNHPREELTGAIGNRNFATSFDADKITMKYSLTHRLNGSINTLDSFFASPSTKDNIVNAKEMDCQYFDEKFTIQTLAQKDCQTWTSPITQPQSQSKETPSSSKNIVRTNDEALEENFDFEIPKKSKPICFSRDDQSKKLQSSPRSFVRTNDEAIEKPFAHTMPQKAKPTSTPRALPTPKVNNDALKDALTSLCPTLAQGATPMVRCDKGEFIIGTYHQPTTVTKPSYAIESANNSQSTLSTTLFKDENLHIQRSAERNIRKEINGYQHNNKDYRVIKLNVEEAAAIIKEAKEKKASHRKF